MLTTPNCLDSRLTDGGKVVSPKHRPHSTPQNIIFLLLVLISVRGLVQPEVLGKFRMFIHLFGSRNRDLPASSSALTTTLTRASSVCLYIRNTLFNTCCTAFPDQFIRVFAPLTDVQILHIMAAEGQWN
jgi:hypothetical protein